MADDDVGLEAELLQPEPRAGHDFRAARGHLEFPGDPVRVRAGRVGFAIGKLPDSGDLVRVGFRQEHDLMRPRRDEVPDDMQELSGEVLVD